MTALPRFSWQLQDDCILSLPGTGLQEADSFTKASTSSVPIKRSLNPKLFLPGKCWTLGDFLTSPLQGSSQILRRLHGQGDETESPGALSQRISGHTQTGEREDRTGALFISIQYQKCPRCKRIKKLKKRTKKNSQTRKKKKVWERAAEKNLIFQLIAQLLSPKQSFPLGQGISLQEQISRQPGHHFPSPTSFLRDVLFSHKINEKDDSGVSRRPEIS